MASHLRELLPASLTQEEARIIVSQQFTNLLGSIIDARALHGRQAPSQAQSLYPFKTQPGVIGVLRKILTDAEEKENVTEQEKILFTEEFPDFTDTREKIVFSLEETKPGAFGEGGPREARVRNWKPVLRDKFADSEHPGYQVAVLGYLFNSIIRLTCYARTNKEANSRVEWLQRVLRQYSWYFGWQGIPQFFFYARGADFILPEKEIKLYGRPLDYFVVHEELSVQREKTMERLIIKSAQEPSTSKLQELL